MGKQQATTSPVKKSKLQRWRRRFILGHVARPNGRKGYSWAGVKVVV